LDAHHSFSLSGAFPAAEIEACIRAALDAEHPAQQVLRPHGQRLEPDVDSLAIMEMICAIEETFGISLPAGFASLGSYPDVEAVSG